MRRTRRSPRRRRRARRSRHQCRFRGKTPGPPRVRRPRARPRPRRGSASRRPRGVNPRPQASPAASRKPPSASSWTTSPSPRPRAGTTASSCSRHEKPRANNRWSTPRRPCSHPCPTPPTRRSGSGKPCGKKNAPATWSRRCTTSTPASSAGRNPWRIFKTRRTRSGRG